MKIKTLVPLWIETKKLYVKKSTLSAYVSSINKHILTEFGEYEDISEQDLQDYVHKKINSGLSIKTVKDIVVIIKMVLEFAGKKGLIKYAKFDLKYPSVREKKELPILSKTHQKKLMDYLAKNFTFRNLGIYICLTTGMRIGEICALTWGDISIESGEISINKAIQRVYFANTDKKHTELIIDAPKTVNSIRDIPIASELLKLLKPIKKIANSSYYVLTNESKPTEPRTYRNYYDNLLVELGIPKLKFHGLRHSFATRCIESECDYKTVSAILGHSNVGTTLNLYVHPNAEQKKKCVDQMFKNIK